MSAAASASEGGARVVLVERRDALGGSTVMSAGLHAYAGTEEQEDAGIRDSSELLRHDILETGHHRNNVALVDAYCADQLETYRWLRRHGIRFGEPRAGAGQTVARSHPGDTTAMISCLSSAAREAGAEISYRSRVRRLLVDDGHVTGVRIEDGDEFLELHAGAVVLTTGGFSRAPGLLSTFAPAMENALRGGAEGSTGDGLLMGCKVGAGLADMPYIKATFGIFPWTSRAEEGTGILPVYKGAIAVNGLGRRFVDESLPYKELGDACLAQPEGIAFQIFDSAVLQHSDSLVPLYDFLPRVEARQIVQGRSLAELAEALGIAAEALVETVGEYNDSIGSGRRDRFGRRSLSGRVGVPVPLVTPPYYGYPCTAVVLATYCGLTVNAGAQVLDVFGDVIPGLWAAGEVIGGFHGAGYVTGTSLGKAAIFGRLAGVMAAKATAKSAVVGGSL